jgi:peptidoglycan-associated lipoprotein
MQPIRTATKLLIPLTLSLAGACATAETKAASPTAKVSTPPVNVAAGAPKNPASAGGTVSAGPNAPSSPIYFAFDSDQLTAEGQQTLKQMADYLRANPKATLTVEGHCDDTGSSEYNLALGDRRARAAVAYLKALGVEEARLNSISFGEEKPAVAGDDEDARAKNRRGQFDLKG